MADPGLIDKTGLRKDALRNIGQLLQATGALLRSDPAEATMQAIAERANVSPATAYRYFPTLQHLHAEFLYSVLVNVRAYSLASQLSGKELFEDVCRNWVQMLEIYGKALTQIRSPRGFLERLDSGETITNVMNEAWDRPVREVLRELGVSENHFRHALLLRNTLFDSREIDDLRQVEGFDTAQIVRHLSETFYGAVRGWATAARAGAPGTQSAVVA